MAVFASVLSPFFRPLSQFVLVGTLGLAMAGGLGFGSNAHARESVPSDSQIALTQLPVQGQRTYEAIFKGGPFRYDKDGTVFGNREQQLPRERRGHYREYTVDTPGARTRGARRIVCGGPKTTPQACWYTADHYASFRRIVP